MARSNSTRSSNENISVMADWVFKNLTQFLKRLENGDATLVDELAAIKGLSRKEKSLSSKICSCLCELEFKQSKFAVNDTVVRRIFPYYFNYTEIDRIIWYCYRKDPVRSEKAVAMSR